MSSPLSTSTKTSEHPHPMGGGFRHFTQQIYEKCLLKCINQWDQFWFAPRDTYPLSLFRVGLCGILFAMYATRFLEVELFYFNKGLVDTHMAKLYYTLFNEPLFYLFPSSDGLIYLLHIFLLLGLLLIALGLSHRLFICAIFLIHLVFIQRNHFIVYGADLFATFWLFFLCFMKTGSHFNFISFIKRKTLQKFFGKISSRGVHQTNSDIMTSVGVRLMQIQICICYGTTGLEKLKGNSWWEGSAIWYVIGNQQLIPFDMSFLYHTPVLIAFMTFSTLIFEIYFPIAIWQRKLRYLWIVFGLSFHLFIALFMNLLYFGLIMIVSYTLWLRKRRASVYKANVCSLLLTQ